MPNDNPALVEDAPKEEERTLTDHLNKKLLESFLSRMEEGTTGFSRIPPPPEDNEEDDGGQEFNE